MGMRHSSRYEGWKTIWPVEILAFGAVVPNKVQVRNSVSTRARYLDVPTIIKSRGKSYRWICDCVLLGRYRRRVLT